MFWFNFFLGLNLNSLFFKVIIIHYHNQKHRKIKFKPRIKLNQNKKKKSITPRLLTDFPTDAYTI